ncbi:MAG: BppU family phage baseplate upper protein [Clostridia bacterium]|nr:BppU family phage baseplate upper protein [Clostridia bacterium]
MVYIKNISLDFNAENKPLTVCAKQNDADSRFLIITPVSDGKQIDMTNVTAVFCAEKPDGSNIMNYAQKDNDGKIIVELTSQTLALSGIVSCEVKLYQGLSVLSSCRFCVNVEKSLSDKAVESTDEFTILTELIAECKAMLKNSYLDYEKPYLSALQTKILEIEQTTYEEVIE